MTIDQREDIKSIARRKQYEKVLEEEKWAIIYRIIFSPAQDTPLPSPCELLIPPLL
jgi:hypothetical protein